MKQLSILVLALAAAVMLACSRNTATYDVTGSNAPKDGAKVYLMDQISTTPIDSAVVAGGAFKMKGTAPRDAFLSVTTEGFGWNYPLINDGVAIKINYADSVVTGSALNQRMSEYDRRNSAAYSVLNGHVNAFLALSEEEQQARMEDFERQYEEELEEYIEVHNGIIEENMDNLVPLVFLSDVPSLEGLEKLDELMESGAPFARHPYAQDLKRKVDASFAKEREAEKAKNAIIGEKFLDLEEADKDGNLHKLSEYVGQGNWVLVDFWASWCGPCKAEMPNVVEVYKKYHGKGFEIVGLSFDRDKEPWVKAITDWEMPWIHLSDLKYWKSVASGVYNVNSIPDNLLIDPEGTVVARGLRGNALKNRLAEIFE